MRNTPLHKHEEQQNSWIKILVIVEYGLFVSDLNPNEEHVSILVLMDGAWSFGSEPYDRLVFPYGMDLNMTLRYLLILWELKKGRSPFRGS